MAMQKIAFFDVDKTLIEGDSMFLLLKYTIDKYPKAKKRLPKLFMDLCFYKLGLINTKKAKESMFYTINYLSDNDLDNFYKEVIKKKIFNDALIEITKLKEEGYLTLLISASPECYLKHFENEEFVDGVIGTKLKAKENFYTNEIEGINCKGIEKVERINQYLKEKGITVDKEKSLAYSDSLSDKPMFDLANKAYLINYKKSNNDYEILKWK
ncbi:MAG: HAD family hydrolase [Sarcina sp.]